MACLIHQRDLPKFLWAEAARHVCLTLNRLPVRGAEHTTPYEQWKGEKPDVRGLKIWGSETYGLIHPETRRGKKLDSRAKKGIFVGYGESLSQHKLYHPQDHKFILYRDVDLNEQIVPAEIPVSESDETPDQKETGTVQRRGKGRPAGSKNYDKFKGQPVRLSKRQAAQSSQTSVPEGESGSASGSDDEKDHEDPDSSASGSETEFEDCSYYALTAAMDTDQVPRNYGEAVSGAEKDHWMSAMQSEMNSHKKNQTWSLVHRPNNRKVIKSRWVFSVKRKPDGSLIKYKARQVAKGFSQTEGVDYTEVFAPVARASSIRTVLSLSAALNMKMKQFDICTAFLYGDLEEDIYMEQPDGWTDGSDKVCKLHKGLYGLKQASRQWKVKFTQFLGKNGFQRSGSDPCVFMAKGERGIDMILCLYVDDGLLLFRSEEQAGRLFAALKKNFDFTTGPVACFVGMEVEQKKDTVSIHQRGYINKMLVRYGMKDCKPAPTPAEPKAVLRKQTDSATRNKDMDQTPYREAIGSLMYAAVVSRPDIAFIVAKLAKFVDNPTPEHWTAAKRVRQLIRR